MNIFTNKDKYNDEETQRFIQKVLLSVANPTFFATLNTNNKERLIYYIKIYTKECLDIVENNNIENEILKQNLLLIASNTNLVKNLNEDTKKRLNDFVKSYTKECLDKIEKHPNKRILSQ